MLAIEPQQHGLLKRSTSIWRRFSRRERSRSPPEEPVPVLRRPSQKLQKRVPETITYEKKPMITHLQRIEISAPRLEPHEPVMPPEKRVLASDMATTAFPNSPHIHTVVWDVFLKPEQIYNLVQGFSPQKMEDKWFVYSEGPDRSGKMKVHFHRSWTGMKIAELFVVIDLKGEGAGKIVGIKWNGTDQTNGMNGEEAKYMISTTCSWVLGVDVEKEGLL